MERQIDQIERSGLVKKKPLVEYQGDPVGYIEDVLGHRLWHRQHEVCQALYTPPYKALVTSCHKTGKTFLAAALTSYYHDCYPNSLVITTGPSSVAVKDQLWREVRVQRRDAGLGGFTGEKATELWVDHDWWAKGFTTKDGESMHGRHQRHMFFVIDEGCGVPPWVYSVFKSMFQHTGLHHWLTIGNPLDTTSQMYQEEFLRDTQGELSWNIIRMSALDHPNIDAGMSGRELPFPAAVDHKMFEAWITDYGCDEIPVDEVTDMDFQWPPNSGKWWRPSPEFQGRALGQWPSAGTFGVWSDLLWRRTLKRQPIPQPDGEWLPEVGCDVASRGFNWTVFHGRMGNCSVYHDRKNGWSGPQIIGKLKNLCQELAERYNAKLPKNVTGIRPEDIPCKVDENGIGEKITEFADDYNFIGVRSSWTHCCNVVRYPNVRSELWFDTAEQARANQVDFSRIPARYLSMVQQQAFAPQWKFDGKGRKQVEKKEETSKRLHGLSPDDMDAVNLCYRRVGTSDVAEFVESE